MNYIKQITAFTDRAMLDGLSTGQMMLWYALMAINNKCGWREWFSVSNKVVGMYSGLSVSGINKNREALKKHGYIDIRFNGQAATEYRINSLAMFEGDREGDTEGESRGNTDGSTVGNTESNRSSNRDSNTLYKQNKKKQNKNIYYNTRRTRFNNYDDGNTSDYVDFDDKVIDSIIAEIEKEEAAGWKNCAGGAMCRAEQSREEPKQLTDG